MKKYLIIIIMVIVSAGSLQAKNDLDLFGYFESQVVGMVSNNQFIHLFSNKLRLDLKTEVSDNITFAANFNIQTYHGKTSWNMLDFLPGDITSKIPPETGFLYTMPFSNRYYLDNAYIKFAFEGFDLMVGKQQISLGTGYVWNPTDVFNVKDFLDPTYEQPGHNAIRVDLPLGSAYSITALYSAGDDFKHSAKLLQFKGRFGHFDYQITAIDKELVFHDYSQFDFETMAFPGSPSSRKLLGLSTVGEILGVGVWAEYAYNFLDAGEDFYELVVGGDYTFDSQTYIMAEYYRNTLGKDDFLTYNLNDWMRMMSQEQKAIARDQLYLMAQHPVSDLLSMSLSGIYCISDNSLAIIPTINYSLSDNVEIIAYINFYTGQDGKSYSKTMGNGGMIRVRVYF